LQSANNVESHHKWIKDIDEVTGSSLKFPIISDKDRKIAYLYDMVDYDDTTNVDEKGTCSYSSSCVVFFPYTILTIQVSP
jgi:glutaredoxin/glutathione-dependent peroxiredoxin